MRHDLGDLRVAYERSVITLLAVIGGGFLLIALLLGTAP